MDRRLVIAIFCGTLVSSVFAADCFFDNIASLANSDAKLNSRQDEKWKLINKNVSKSQYLEILQNIKSSGRTFSCGYTRGWIAEILQGLSAQYDEFKVKVRKGWPAAGYANVTGQKVVRLFNTNLHSTQRILYKFQIVGPLDHVWMVEQLPHGGGYRVYQSYNNAYSLKAWLATGNLMAMHGTDIIIWHDVIKMADMMLKAANGSMSDLDNLPARFVPLKPWLVHIRDYNLTQVETELRKSWSVIGQGRIMNKDYFYMNYLTKLANMTEAIIPLVSTSKAWTHELHEQWTELFGAPNPVLYPGFPFNTMTAAYSQNYALEVKTLVINGSEEGKCSSNAKILHDSVTDCFFDNVKTLSNYDELLYSRNDKKIQLVKSGASLSTFLTIMTKIKSSGQTFACGYTRSWIAEILQGLTSQYHELKVKFANGTRQAGFANVTGQKVVELFNKHLNSTQRILYKFQIVGPLDHVWMVEQLPHGGGYRVYQSYNNAYSLKAWLATGSLMGMRGTDIIIWHDVIKMADMMLKAANGSMSDLDNLPARFVPLKPWLVHIRDYNLTQVETELRKSWSVIGQGRIMNKDYFYKNYLTKLANMTEAIIPFVSTSKVWTKQLHEQWTELFGAPNPVLYPGFPFNTMTSAYSQNYALEVKTLVINGSEEGKCSSNAKILHDSVMDCFYDSVKNLSWFDRLLNSRLEEKNKLIKSGTKKSQWLSTMRTIKSSGKTYSCGFTRSWIAEILQGLPSQYSELVERNNTGTQAAGFINVTGSKIVDLLIKNAGSTKRIIYKFQIVGPLDHVWMVEQLPYGGGYRVYQSYNNAYSLKAWLAKKDHQKMHGSDIMIWYDVINMASQFLKPYGGSMSDLDNLPGPLSPMKSWLMFIKNYNITQVDANLKKAWSKFGQGKINTKDYFFSNYLYILGNLTEKIIPLVSTSKQWTQELHDQWILLFGSPNPVLYPGFAFNQLTAQYSQKYALEVKQLVIDDAASPANDSIAEANCKRNADVLEKSLHCFVDGIRELSSHEKMLNSRYNEKVRLVKQGTNQSEYLLKMKNFQPTLNSNGQTFAGNYTSNWIDEILQGLSIQFNDLRKQSQGNMSGFTNITGRKQLLDIFTKHSGSWKRLLYHFSIASHTKNVWIVEQLSYGKGYRIYMSNADAFSINAWLSPTVNDLNKLRGKEIFVWTNAKGMSNNFLKRYSASLDKLGGVPVHLRPWMESIRDYNISQVDKNLQKAWKPFGGGAVIPRTIFFDQYLAVLGRLTDSLISLVGTSNPWTKELQENWIKLFGSPNPMLYPGVAYNTYSGGIARKHPLSVRITTIDELNEANCPTNMMILRKFIGAGYLTPKPPVVTKPKPDNAVSGLRPVLILTVFAAALPLFRLF